jgi:hypothetical protein
MAKQPSQKQQNREMLLWEFVRIVGCDHVKAEAFDESVCKILNIDSDKYPHYEYLGDVLMNAY